MHKILLSMLFLVAVEQVKGNPDSLSYPHEIDLFCPDHIFVKTVLGDTEGYFLIDNGTPGSCLFEDGYIALGRNPEEMVKGVTRIDTLEVSLNKKIFTIRFNANLGYGFAEGYPGMKIFGIIGTSLLSAYTTTYDYLNSKLILNPYETPLPKDESNLVNLHFGPQGHTFIKNCKIQNFNALIHFDTGIQHSFRVAFDRELAKMMNVKDEVISNLQIGNLHWYNQKWFPRNFRYVHGFMVFGEIGGGIMSNCAITIYHKEEKASITRSPAMKRGGYLGVKIDLNCKVTAISNDLIANKIGIRIGDTITQINSSKVTNLYELKHHTNLWNINTPLVLEVIRENEKLQLESKDFKDMFEYKTLQERFAQLGDSRGDKEIIDKPAIAELIDVRDETEKEVAFSINNDNPIRIYAIGEGKNNQLSDYGWITERECNKVVWEMNYNNTIHAGGHSINRKVDEVITLEKGDYILHYKTDAGHAFMLWFRSPPNSWFWGIKIIEHTKPNNG